MNKNKLTIGILLLLAGIIIEILLPRVLFTLFSTLRIGGVVGVFLSSLITLVTVVIFFIKGGSQIIKSANIGKIRSENARAVLVGGLLIFAIPKILTLLTTVSYDLAYLISGFIVPLTMYFIPHILALGMVVIAFFILSKKQTQEDIDKEERIARQPAPYSKLTYIGSVIVALPFLAASLLLFEELYSFPDAYLLPQDPTSSNLFWVFVIILIIYSLFTQGLQFYTVEYRDSSGKKVSIFEVGGERAFGDQIGAYARTFLMPIFIAAIAALIPYYILYFTMGFFLKNGFTIALLLLLMLSFFGALFVYSRKNKNRTGEILWLVSWFFFGLFVLFLLFLFL